MDRIQCVAIDLDGTLLNNHHQISPGNAAAVAACRARGVEVFIASGRTWMSVEPYCRELGLVGPQITLNGGAIATAPGGPVEVTTRFPEPVLQRIGAALRERGLPFVIFGGAGIYAPPGTPEAAELEGFGEPPAIIVPTLEGRHLPDPVKILVFAPDRSKDADLIALAHGEADTVRTHSRFFEYVVPGVTKGTALDELIRRHGWNRRSVLAVGDYHNDLGLFKAAGVSVAMGNAPLDVQRAADFVTATCEQDGLARALERHVLGTPLPELQEVTS